MYTKNFFLMIYKDSYVLLFSADYKTPLVYCIHYNMHILYKLLKTTELLKTYSINVIVLLVTNIKQIWKITIYFKDYKRATI